MARHNLGTVLSFEFRRTVGRRRFWISTLIVPVAVGIVLAMVYLSNSASTRSEDALKDSRLAFSYTDESGLISRGIAARFGGSPATDPDRALAAVKAGAADAYFTYPADPRAPIQVHGLDKGLFENGKYEAIARQLLTLSAQERIGDPDLAAAAQDTATIDAVTYRDGLPAGGINEAIPPLAFLAIFYLTIMLMGNHMLNSTLEEKENRVTEMILTTMSASTLVIGKFLSLIAAGILQILLFSSPFIIGYLFFREELNFPNLDLSSLVFDPGAITVGALLLTGGFLLFTATLVAAGAALPTAKDAGAVFGTMMGLIFVPFYVFSLIASNPQAPVVQVFTFFPYSAPVTAMLRNGFGSLAGWEAAVIVAELFALAALMFALAVRIFRHGSIAYTSKVSLGSVLGRGR
jgi:ABC-2 type transport system permease protein